MGEKYSREELLEKLRQLAREEARSPTMDDMRKADGYPDPVEYINVFGWWNEAKKEAGLEPNRGGPANEPPRRKYSREELLEKLRELNDELPHTVRHEDMDEADRYPSGTVYIQRFGSWNAAKAAAGIDTDSNTYSDEELITFLQQKAAEIGDRPLRRDDIKNDDNLPHPSIYNDRFESFHAAKKAAGILHKYPDNDDR